MEPNFWLNYDKTYLKNPNQILTYPSAQNAVGRVDLEQLSNDGSIVWKGIDNFSIGSFGVIWVKSLDLEHFGSRVGILEHFW